MASHFRLPKAKSSDFRGESEAMGPSDETEREKPLSTCNVYYHAVMVFPFLYWK